MPRGNRYEDQSDEASDRASHVPRQPPRNPDSGHSEQERKDAKPRCSVWNEAQERMFEKKEEGTRLDPRQENGVK